MFEFKLPNAFWIFKRYGLLVTDDEVVFFSCARGRFEQLGVFSNDAEGVSRFEQEIKANEKKYRGKTFHIVVNVIGEDYRFERVAHLIGKYRNDFHARRCKQFFRGSNLYMSEVHGREELGRREDLVLFYGVLTSQKVEPWVKALQTVDAQIAGAHPVSLVSKPIYAALGISDPSALVITFHENGMVRQTYFTGGRPRFSRFSRDPGSGDKFIDFLRRDIDRGLQYLTSLKLGVGQTLSINIISPSEMMGQLRESITARSERFAFRFHDAATIAKKMGISKPLREIGRDSSFSLQSVFAFLRYQQLLPLDVVRFYWLKFVGGLAALAVGAYAAFQLLGSGLSFLNTWQDYQSINADKEVEVAKIRRQYNDEISAFGVPPSSPENMRAVSNLFAFIDSVDFSPTPIFLYLSRTLESSSHGAVVNSIDWYISSDVDGASEQSLNVPYLSGGEIFQVLELRGEFLSIPGERSEGLIARAQEFFESFEERPDILVQAISLPQRDEESLESGVLTGETQVDMVTDRNFVIRVVWKQVGEDLVNRFVEQNTV